jgi:hypothetical protein
MSELHQQQSLKFEFVYLLAIQFGYLHLKVEIHWFLIHLLELYRNQILNLKNLNIHRFNIIDALLSLM